MSDYPMLISNKLHSFRNFIKQIFKIYNKNWGKLRLEYLSYNLYYVNNNILK